MITIFETEKYKIKTFTIENFDDFCKLNQDKDVSKFVNHNDGKPKTFKECVDKYSDIIYAQQKYGYSYWAIYDKNNKFLGQCGSLRSWSGDVNFCYALHKKYWGNGIGTEVCSLVLNYLFKNFDNIKKIETSAFEENIPSNKLLIKIGFSLTKKDEEFDKILNFYLFTREDYEKKRII